MSRLIDATIQALPMTNYILERKDTIIKVLQEGDNDFLFAMMMDYFDEQPIAYDVDKIVEELEERKTYILKEFILKGRAQIVKDSSLVRLNEIDGVIEIIRKGGLNE